MSNSFLKRRSWGIRHDELLAFIGFYIFLAVFYHATLWINRMGFQDQNDVLFDPINFLDDSGLDYFLKFLITIPIWYILFRELKHISLNRRLFLHLLFLPAFVIIWQQSYYFICELIGFGHLGGVGKVWDIYIPALFYVLQFGVLHAYNYYRENQRKLKLEGELRTAALKSELSALKAQLNPHFLYNIFNTISASVPPEQEKTRDMIAELSDLFRYQLKASKVERVPLREELDFINKYLALEKERFQDRLKIEVNIDNDIMDEMIPPMLLQPLVENSIKHGLASLIEGGTISISITKSGDRLAFEIADTGVGIADKEKVFEQGIGLTNTRLRLEKMCQSTLKLSDNFPRGLKINFSI
ncbi:MAG: histidine kinase [Flavobacteriaceae bacterium]|nr:histidine kinase [Flavobacteriaceae bacterium]